jgi:formylglycine-generating enzyme required for sulfatase activity
MWQPDGSSMVYIAAGEFTMGSSDAQVDEAWQTCERYYSNCDRVWFEDERPQHGVYLDGFWIDRYEVTNLDYRRCVDAGGCLQPSNRYLGNPQYDHYPVVNVSWDEARAYCQWSGKRLPSEAEWEKAARGSDGRVWPWGDAFDPSRANGCDVNCAQDWRVQEWNDGYADTSPVGAYAPQGDSPYGASDMAGNVWEWVTDWYSESYYGQSPDSNPRGPDAGDRRVVRGGSFASRVYYLRTSHRMRYAPEEHLNNVGFRCAR